MERKWEVRVDPECDCIRVVMLNSKLSFDEVIQLQRELIQVMFDYQRVRRENEKKELAGSLPRVHQGT